MTLLSIKSELLDFMWRVFQHTLPAGPYLKLRFLTVFKHRLNLQTPETFSEKLQWLKLYGCRDEYSPMVDKIEVKKIIGNQIGYEYVLPTIAEWKNVDEMDFSLLPDRFVLKCNHDSGTVIFCKDKKLIDTVAVRKTLKKALGNNYYLMGREAPYRNVQRRIFAEDYLEDHDCGEIRDYKVHCFNGEPKVVLVCQNRFSESGLTEDFFTMDWEHLNLKRPEHPNSGTDIQAPQQLLEMERLSRILSRDIPFLRVDFYIVNDRLYVGELTFFPSSGLVPFVPGEWDRIWGDWLALPKK